MMKRFIIIAAIICLLASCDHSSDNSSENKPDDSNNPVKNAAIIFDNTQGICTVSVYEDYRRREEDKIADIPAGKNSVKFNWTAGASVPFYFSYHVILKDVSGFSLNYVPEIGRDQKAIRIDADVTTTIKIPVLSETISSPDKPLSDDSYLFIKNNSFFSFELHQGNSKLKPDNISSPVVNDGEQAQYTVNPGAASNYRLLVGADYFSFPVPPANFEAGHIYNFDFDGSISLVRDTELKLENVNGVTVPQPPAAPTVITSNSSLTLQWTAVESATAYEIWMSTVNDSASASKFGADVTASLTVTISGLNNGTTYYFWLKAKNKLGTSGFSPVASGTPSAFTVKPSDPQTAPSIIAGNGQLSLSWQAVVDASAYEIWAGTANNTQNAAKRGGDVIGLSTVVTGLSNGTTYYVWIKAKNNIGISGFSPGASAKPLGTPGTPTLSPGSMQLLVTWTAVAGADQYEVYYGIDTPTTLAVTTAGTTATITGLTNGTAYYVRLRAKNASGTSDYGPSSSETPSAPIIYPPGTPGTPTLSPGNKQLLVTWTAVIGAEQYEVYYGTGTPETLAVTTSGTTATISGLTNGTTYYVRLRAKNTGGVSDYGPSASGVPNLSPGLYRGTERIGNQNLTDSLTYISNNAVSGNNFYIVLGANESISPKTLSYSGKTVGITLLGYGSERTITLSSNGSMFTVGTGVTLTLDEKIALVGKNQNNASLVYVDSSGNLIMNNGSKISGNKGNREGGGVHVFRNATFIMSGGEISGNNSLVGGGVLVNNGTFMMSNGKITGNDTFTSSPDYTSGGGGGVYISGNNATFTMTGGEITGNTASAVASGTSGYPSSRGGGVYVANQGTFTMTSGKITGNTASSSNLSNSTSSYGGGVYVGTYSNYSGPFGTFIKSGGGTITGYASDTVNGNVAKEKNVVQNNKGHAVYIGGGKRRESTAGPGVNMDSSVTGAAGGWEN